MIPEHFKIVAIVTVKAIVGSKPDKAPVILENTGYRIIREAIFNTQVSNRLIIVGKRW